MKYRDNKFFDYYGREIKIGSYVLMSNHSSSYSLLRVNLFRAYAITGIGRMLLESVGAKEESDAFLDSDNYEHNIYNDTVTTYCMTDMKQIEEIKSYEFGFSLYVTEREKRIKDRELVGLSIYGLNSYGPLYLLEIGSDTSFVRRRNGEQYTYTLEENPIMSFHLFSLTEEEEDIKRELIANYKEWEIDCYKQPRE